MQRIMALVGPTAVGKTAIAVELAQQLNAEIVSCDSMQVYRRMAALSQAPSATHRARVQHHLIECIEPTQNFSAGQYQKIAAGVINQILERGKRVLIVGGTGLYLRALTQGICDVPPADVRIREQLWSECQGIGAPSMHNRLRSVDETAASKIHPNDARRIIRALEVFAVTGRPLSSWWKEATSELTVSHVPVIGLDRAREELYERIDQRLLTMIYEEGVINEVRLLLRLPLSRSARQVHGLHDLERYLAGDVPLKETIETWQQRVRHYAKRQMTWFRKTPGLTWLIIPKDEPTWETAARALRLLRHEVAEPAVADPA